jgi:hypothetical protein
MTSTFLVNLAKIGQLDAVPASPERVQRILVAARQQLKDAHIEQASNETRFDCAYNAIRASADIGLLINGFRTSTGRPGHHQTAIQCLGHTLSIDEPTIRLLDGLRKQRSGSNYDGDMVTAGALSECLRQAKSILARVEAAVISKEAGAAGHPGG